MKDFTNLNTFQLISEIKEKPYYENYKDFFDKNLTVLESLENKKNKSKTEQSNLKVFEAKISSIFSQIDNIESSSNFQNLSDDEKNYSREILTNSLKNIQKIDEKRHNITFGDIAKSGIKPAIGTALAVGITVAGAATGPVGATFTGIISAGAGFYFKDKIKESVGEFAKNAYAYFAPDSFQKKDIQKTISGFDVTKFNSITNDFSNTLKNNPEKAVYNLATQASAILHTTKEELAPKNKEALEPKQTAFKVTTDHVAKLANQRNHPNTALPKH